MPCDISPPSLYRRARHIERSLTTIYVSDLGTFIDSWRANVLDFNQIMLTTLTWAVVTPKQSYKTLEEPQDNKIKTCTATRLYLVQQGHQTEYQSSQLKTSTPTHTFPDNHNVFTILRSSRIMKWRLHIHDHAYVTVQTSHIKHQYSALWRSPRP